MGETTWRQEVAEIANDGATATVLLRNRVSVRGRVSAGAVLTLEEGVPGTAGGHRHAIDYVEIVAISS